MIGTDIVKISRIADAVNSDAFLNRVFTNSEREYCDAKPDRAQSYAGIFCAKEAAVKAVKCGFGGGVMPTDIEIGHDGYGAPTLTARGGAARFFDGRTASVSISHDGDYAVAVVMITETANGKGIR